MKKHLRNTALVVLLAAAGFWVFAGANTGWTMTRVPRRTLDPVTGLEGVTYEKKFVPGIDFLIVAAVGSSLIAGVSCLFRDKTLT
jgi:hypothetical protein